MAKKGTYAGLGGPAPRVDYAGEARKVTAGFQEEIARREEKKRYGEQKEFREKEFALRERAQAFQEKLALGKLKAASGKQAQELQDKAFKDAIRLNEMQAKALDYNTSGLMNPVLAKTQEVARNDIAAMKREYLTATPGRKIQIDQDIRGRMLLADYFKSFGEQGNKLFADIPMKLGQKGGYSQFQNADTIMAINEAWMSAADNGLKQVGKDAYMWGDRIRVDNMGKGNMSMSFLNNDGSVAVSGSIGEIMGKVQSQFKPFVDLEGEIGNLASGMAADFTTDYTDEGELMRLTKKANRGSTISKIKKRLKAKYDKYNNEDGTTTSSFIKELYAMRYANDYDDAINGLAEDVYDQLKTQTTDAVRNSPDLSRKKKQQDLMDYGDMINKASLGDVSALTYAKANKWPDSAEGIPPGSTLDKIEQLPNEKVVHVLAKETKGKKTIYVPRTFRYDMTTKGGRDLFKNFLIKAINQGTGENYSPWDLRDLQIPHTGPKTSPTIEETMGDLENKSVKDIKDTATPVLKDAGYKVDIKKGITGKTSVSIKDADGNDVVPPIKTRDKKQIADTIQNAINTIQPTQAGGKIKINW